MKFLIIVALVIYFSYHVASRSDIFKGLRDWVNRCFPAWMTYPLSCCFCWTFHCVWLSTLLNWFWTGHLSLSIGYLFAIPVINFVLDLVVQHLIRSNSPPIIRPTVNLRLQSYGGTSTPQITHRGEVQITPPYV